MKQKMIQYATARTCPIDPETGKFQSEVAEFAYANEAAKLGITREQFRCVLQAHNFAEDKSKAEYEKFQAALEKEIANKMLLHFSQLAKAGEQSYASMGERMARNLASEVLSKIGCLDETAVAGFLVFVELTCSDYNEARKLI